VNSRIEIPEMNEAAGEVNTPSSRTLERTADIRDMGALIRPYF
jgi:hypothetical protein